MVTEDMDRFTDMGPIRVPMDALSVYHFMTKSWQEFAEKAVRDGATSDKGTLDFFDEVEIVRGL